METLLYILEGILIFLFLLAGFFKLIQTKEKIAAGGGKWAEDVPDIYIKIIGGVEFLLAIGLLVPWFCCCPFVSVISAIGMGIVMAGAAALHFKRKEMSFVAFTLLLSLVAFFVAYQNWYGCCTASCPA